VSLQKTDVYIYIYSFRYCGSMTPVIYALAYSYVTDKFLLSSVCKSYANLNEGLLHLVLYPQISFHCIVGICGGCGGC
jgi:hypothetical protein